MKIWKRIRPWQKRAEFQGGLEEEMRFHRETAGGAAFGSMAIALEDSHAVWAFGGFESLWQDVRYAWRVFRKSQGSLMVAGTVDAALGLNTAMFTVFNAGVLRAFAVHTRGALRPAFTTW